MCIICLNCVNEQISKRDQLYAIAKSKQKSPILFNKTALIADLTACNLVDQNPINKYEHIPTPSHAKKN